MTSINEQRRLGRARRHRRVRGRVNGTPDRPRLNVFRSLTNIYGQLIDDSAGHTLLAVSTLDPEVKAQSTGLKKSEQARLVGRVLAQRALDRGIKRVVFDRGG